MEQNKGERLGFFRRMFLAMTDFRLYPFVQREKVKVATAYFTLLIMLYTIVLSLVYSNKLFEVVRSSLNSFDENVPEFTFKDGNLNVSEKIYDTNADGRIIVDTSVNHEEFANTEVGKETLYSNSFVVINSDGAIIGSKDSTIVYLFKSLKIELTKDKLHEYLLLVENEWTAKLAIICVIWLGLFIAYYIIKMINVLFLILMSWILNIIFGMRLKFGNYYRIVVYALTLPLIVELISIAILGRLPEFAVMAYQLLAYVYIFYALRAIRLDILLISTPGTNFKEKIENMMQKLENEIQEKSKKEEPKESEENKEPEEDKKDDK